MKKRIIKHKDLEIIHVKIIQSNLKKKWKVIGKPKRNENISLNISKTIAVSYSYEKKAIVGKAILATKKVILNNRERERPFNINAVKRVLYHLTKIAVFGRIQSRDRK